MGAAGFGPVDNDDAGDWISQLWDAQNIAFLQQSLELGLLDHLYLSAPKGSVLIAASEVVAEGCGVGAPDLPRQAKNWILRHPNLLYKPLQKQALRALRRVLGARSELNQLWGANHELHSKWKQRVLNLVERLSDVRSA